MNDKKRIIKSTIVYLFGNVLTRIISFFMLPLYTKFIPAGDMGYYDSVLAILSFFVSVLFFDIGSGIMRFMFDKNDVETKSIPILNGLLIFLFSIGLYIVSAFVFGFTVKIEYFIWITVLGLLMSLNNVYGSVARGLNFNSLYALSGVVGTAITVTGNFIFLVVLKMDYVSLYISSCLGMLASIIILEIKCKVLFKIKIKYFDKALLKAMMKFCLPLCVNSVAFWLLSSANRLIVSSALGVEQNGYLAIANKFSQIIYLISTCIQLAWQELAFSKENNINESATGIFYSKAFDFYLKVLLIFVLLLIPLIKLGLTIYPAFIDSSYTDAVVLIPLALTGTVVTICSSFLGSIFGGLKKTNIIFVSTLIGAAVNIGVIYALINTIGVMAANVALLAGYGASVLIRTIMLRKIIDFKVRYWYFLIFVPLLTVVILAFNNTNWIYSLICLICISGIGILVFYKEIGKLIKKKRFPNEKKNEK